MRVLGSLVFFVFLISSLGATSTRVGATPTRVGATLGSPPTTLHAHAPHAQFRHARLYKVEDQISQWETPLAETVVDSLGNFSFSFPIEETQQMIIRIDFYQTYIYVQPGEHYRLIFDEFDYRMDEKINPAQWNQNLSYRFAERDSNELNQLIWRFENLHDRFLNENFWTIYREGNTQVIEHFIQDIRKTFAYTGHGYFLQYMRYGIAEMERIFNLKSAFALYNEYLFGQENLLHNGAYTDFLQNYYTAYFPTHVKYPYPVFMRQIHQQPQYDALMDSLGRDTSLQNQRYRELVLLVGLKDLASNPDFQKKSLLRWLDTVASRSRFVEHQKLARHLRYKLSEFESGQSSPDFSFKSLDGKSFSLSDFSGKLLYVLLVDTRCRSCEAELRQLQDLAQKKGQEMHFLALNCDYEFNKFLYNAPRNKPSYHLLNFNKHFDVLRKWGIFDYPAALLIGGDGTILRFDAPRPGQGVERWLESYLQPPSQE